jgi:UPF0755 protein
LRALAFALLVSAFAAVASLWAWASSAAGGEGRRLTYVVKAGVPASELAAELAELGVISSPRLFALYLGWAGGEPSPGTHLLRDDLSARELVQRLARLPGRPVVRLTFPEGWNHFQMAERLEQREVVAAEAFRAAARDPALLSALGVRGPNAEGRLFPATYDFLVDSDPQLVLRLLVEEGQKRLARIRAERKQAFEALERRFGWSELEILTLASMVEKEAARPDELPVIASVFFNRLNDPDFRPLRTLQSDPTAAYGCQAVPALAPSCREYAGRVTPAMVRDAANPYNTYKIAGLPPGPIANPGEKAILAVLAPATTDYLYFVSRGGGRHTFTRSFAEHRQAIESRLEPATP